jgi:ABC-2 type transport system permease protein
MGRRYLEAYLLMVRNSLVREMSFKANFILWMVVELLWFMGQIVFIEVLFGYVDRIGDWSKWQVVALFGTHQIISQLFQGFFFQNLSTLPDLIRTGKLDLMLLLPIDAQFAVSIWRFGMDNMVNAVVGCAIVAFSLAKLHFLPGVGNIVLYASAVAMGVAIQYSLMLSLSTLAFWIVRAQGIIFGYFNLSNIGRYPDVIYRGVFKVIFSYVVPMILVANVPVRLLTNAMANPLAGFGKMLLVTLCLVAAVRTLWVTALRRYSSASS